ncbi:MAG: hypothetical protein AB1765_08095 [Candidatus Hydrogenedentota bacterium]
MIIYKPHNQSFEHFIIQFKINKDRFSLGLSFNEVLDCYIFSIELSDDFRVFGVCSKQDGENIYIDIKDELLTLDIKPLLVELKQDISSLLNDIVTITNNT